MRYIVTLERPNKTKVINVEDAKSEKEAKVKAVDRAKEVAVGKYNIKSKIIQTGVPLKVVSVEPWDDCSLRVVKGDKQYDVLLVTKQGAKEAKVKGTAGVKSTYAYVIKQTKPQGEVSVYIEDLDQKPQSSNVPNTGFITKKGRRLQSIDIKSIIENLLTKIINSNTPHKFEVKEEIYQNQYTGRMSKDYSGEISKIDLSDLEGILKGYSDDCYCVSALDNLLENVYIDRWIPTYQSNSGKKYINYKDLLEEGFKEWKSENFAIYEDGEEDEDLNFKLDDIFEGFIRKELIDKYYKQMVKTIKVPFKKESIDKIVEGNKDKIIEYIKNLERQYASRGKYNQYENMRVLFNLANEELHTQVSGQGIAQDVVEGIEQGSIIEVYRFRSGDLADAAEEGIVGDMTVDEYIEDYVNSVVDINIDYLNSIKE